MTLVRRLDRVVGAVSDTEAAVLYFADRLGLHVGSSEGLASPHVRLTYLDAGNALIQLVEPLDADTDIARYVSTHGEGLHQVCLGVDDVEGTAATFAEPDASAVRRGSGRGRVSAFVPGPAARGVRLECTQFSYQEDVDSIARWPQ